MDEPSETGVGKQTSLLDELRAARASTGQCMLCTWLSTQPTDEQAEWALAMIDRQIRNTTILRSARARGYSGTSTEPITHHRNDKHKAPSA